MHRVKLRIKTDSKQFEIKDDDEESMAEAEDAAAANDDGANVVSNTGLDHDEESQDMVREYNTKHIVMFRIIFCGDF